MLRSGLAVCYRRTTSRSLGGPKEQIHLAVSCDSGRPRLSLPALKVIGLVELSAEDQVHFYESVTEMAITDDTPLGNRGELSEIILELVLLDFVDVPDGLCDRAEVAGFETSGLF